MFNEHLRGEINKNIADILQEILTGHPGQTRRCIAKIFIVYNIHIFEESSEKSHSRSFFYIFLTTILVENLQGFNFFRAIIGNNYFSE